MMLSMLEHLFKPRKKQLSKIEYWKKWELFELIEDLHKAESFLLECPETSHINSLSLGDFKNHFSQELYTAEFDNVPDFTPMWKWFMPGCEWEHFTGNSGSALAKNIFARLDRWKRNHEFIAGTKVSLRGEFGVVLNSTESIHGMIRWDTDKESDVEDWRGLFGTFTDQGGQVINHQHEFKFIDDNGTLKKQ